MARSAVSVEIASHGSLCWIPQETILFDGARLHRHLSAHVAQNGRLLLAEAVIFGRAAMGESLSKGLFRDCWRIRRDGRLVFAEDLRLSEPLGDALSAKAGFNGARTMATILMVADNAETFVEPARFLLSQTNLDAGVSSFDGLITARILAPNSPSLRSGLMPLIALLSGRDLPRIWTT
jgi:urease accessory protein